MIMKITRKKTAVLFDLDGTLADSISLAYHIYDKFMKMLFLSPTPEEFKELNGPSLKECIKIIKRKHNVILPEGDLLKQYISIFSDMYLAKVQIFPEVKEVLERLSDSDIKIGLTTSNLRNLTERFLKSSGIYDYFDIIVTSDDVSNSKPLPDIYHFAMKKLGSEYNYFGVEDSEKGLLAVNTAGIKSVHINREGSDAVNTESDYVIESLSSILDIVK